MTELLKKLIPQGSKSIGIWFLLLVFLFLFYYSYAYKSFEEWAYEQMIPSKESNTSQVDTNVKVLLIESPRYVSNFLENRLSVTLENISDEFQTILLAVNYVPKHNSQARIEIHSIKAGEEALDQNYVLLEDIPPHSRVKASFNIRVSNGKKGESFDVEFMINQKEFQPSNHLNIEFDSSKRLKLWAVSMFLFPPGSNILLPIISMLMASWWESFAIWNRGNENLSLLERLRKSWHWVIILLAVTGVVALTLPCNCFVITVLGVFIVVTLLCYLSEVYDFLSSNAEKTDK